MSLSTFPIWPLAFTAILFSASCEKSQPQPQAKTSPFPSEVMLQGKTMGTTYTLKMRVDSAQQSAKAVSLQDEVDVLLREVNAQMSTYDPKSELSLFNVSQEKSPFAVSTQTASVIKRALEIGELSGGAFDVTLGPLIKAWGFDGKKTDARPTDAALAKAKSLVGFRQISVDKEGNLLKEKPGIVVNLSAIAKGHGVDRVSRLLASKGFASHMVEIGGEVFAQGKSAKNKAWTLGVNVPENSATPTAAMRAVPVNGRGLATSGNYRNYFESGGKRYGHIIDPRTALPVQVPLVSVSILAADCMTADALATTAMVMGETEMRKLLATHFVGVEALFIREVMGKDAQKSFALTTTKGWPSP